MARGSTRGPSGGSTRWARGAAALIAISGLCAGAIGADATSSDTGIRWQARPDALHHVATSSDIAATLRSLRGNDVVVVQLLESPTSADRVVLRAGGLTLLSRVGHAAFYARLDAALDEAAIAKTGLLAGAEAIDVAWKIEPRLIALRDQGLAQPLWGTDWASLPHDGTPPNRRMGGGLVVPLLVIAHADRDAKTLAMQIAGAVPEAVVEGTLSTVPVLSVRAPLSSLSAIASIADVQWIEPALPALGENNFENRALTGVEAAQASPWNLSGTGVGVFVFDGGLVMTNHQAYNGRVTITETGSDGTSSHATHCAGTVGGSGLPAADLRHRGMAPAVTFTSAGVSITGATGWLYTNPTDIEADYIAAFNAGADIATNSIGTNVEFNGFDCTWHGNYGAVSVLLDGLVRGGSDTFNEGDPARLVWAAGNERGGSRCAPNNPGFNKMAPPAPTKNLLLVGAVNADQGSNGDTIASFSSFGPTDDGRLKPEIVAPGCQIGGDAGVTSATSSSTSSYGALCGTSMACPTVAGMSALLLESIEQQFPGLPTPRNSTLRAIFSNTAVDLGNPGPDFQFGYGSVRMIPALELAQAANFREAYAHQGEVQSFEVLVPEGESRVRITLAWDDAPGNPAVIPQLVNDLDLEVIDPTGVRRGVWRLDPSQPALPATRSTGEVTLDTLNNIEQVEIDAPAPGVYTVRVIGTAVPQGEGEGGELGQSFSLASSHELRSLGGVPLVFMRAVELAPPLREPGVPTTVRFSVTPFSDELVAGSVRVMYQPEGTGTPAQAIMPTTTDGRVFEAALPGFACGTAPRYWFEAAGVATGPVTLPAGASTGNAFSTAVGAYTELSVNPLESITGWAGSGNAGSGRWTNMDPQQTSSTDGTIIFQPEDDTSPNGTRCWVTDGRRGTFASQFDVDAGNTILTSPAIDLTGVLAPRIAYNRWFYSFASSNPFDVEASADNGMTWVRVERVVATDNDNARGGWREGSFALSDVTTAPVTSVRVRFIASDGSPTEGLVEAAIDDLRVLGVTCDAPGGCDSIDFNNDGLFPSDEDTVAFFAALAGEPCAACNDIDFNNDGLFPSDDDVAAFLRVLAGGDC